MSDAFQLSRTCRDFRTSQASRRGFLHAGVLGTAGLSLASLLRGEAAAATTAAKSPPAKAAGGKKLNNVIILWMRGGPSHIDMWDPKPDAPEEFRGEFGTISSKVPGIQLTDMLPKTAAIMDKWSIVRSLHHGDAGHSYRRPDVLHRLWAGSRSVGKRRPQLRLDRGRATGQAESRTAGLCDDSQDGPRHRLGLSGRREQTVRDPGRPGSAGAVPGRRISPWPKGSRSVGSATGGNC